MAPDISGPIDYNACSYSQDPTSLDILGQGVTWSGRIRPLLTSYCGGCHGGSDPQDGLDLLAGGVYQRLLQASGQQPGLNLIQPGVPEQSYLWRKLVGDGSISGEKMPIDALGTGSNQLPAEVLADIETWILAGALE